MAWRTCHYFADSVSGAAAPLVRFLWCEVLLPPEQFLLKPMDRVPGAPAAVVLAGVTDELGRDALLLQRGVHLLGL